MSGAHLPLPRSMVRPAAVIAAVLVALVTMAGPAAAHNVLIKSDPADGATLSTAPASVSFTFDQPIKNFAPVLAVIGPAGRNFASSDPVISGDTISVSFADGPAGDYRAAYRIVSADGHPVTGQITFTLTAAAAGDATGTPLAGSESSQLTNGDAAPVAGENGDSSGSGALWMWIGIGVAAILVIVAAAVVVAGRKPGRS